MRKLLLIVVLGLVLLSTSASAQVSNTISGGKASDYQPPTDNPQSRVGTGLQTTGTGLQPVPGQANLSQENLSGSSDLQVVGTTNTPNPNTTSIPKFETKRSLNSIPFVLIGVLTVAGVIYVVVQPSDKRQQKVAVGMPETPKAVRPEPLPKVKPKKAKQKSGTKKRKK